MAGKIVADTLEHSTAGSIATNYVVEGSAKVWNCFNASGTITLRDSLNVASLTDNGTSNFDTNLTSSFTNDDYSFQGAVGIHAGAALQFVGGANATAKDTGQYGIRSSNHTGSFGDSDDYMTVAHGELA